MRELALRKGTSRVKVLKYFAAAVAAAALTGCASAPKPMIPTAAPERVPLFVVDGNPASAKTVHVALDGVPLMDIGWRYTGTSSTTPGFQFPPGVDMKGRQTLFYEVSTVNLAGHPIRFIQAYSTESSIISVSEGNTKRAPKLLKRADLGDLTSQYDITSPSARVRADFYVYGTRDGARPYSENTYVYWVEGLDKWFAVKYVRGGPDKE